MRVLGLICVFAGAAISLTGCGNSQSGSQVGATPDSAVREFLTAVKAGDSKKASQMLTSLTRQKTAEAKLDVAPEASDTASFEVGQVEYVAADKSAAHVASQWTDIDEQKNSYTREYLWILRKEAEGWRICGMAARIFPDMEPLVLNFEDPEDMVRKQEFVAQEISRREAEQQSNLEARQPDGQQDRR